MNFCPYCGGKIVSPEAKFCMSCGKSLESFMNQSQAAPAPEPVLEAKPVDIPETTAYEYSIDAKSKGTVAKICVNTGAVVNRGDVLLTVTNYFSGEEETIYADEDAVVKNFAVKVGQTVKPNDTLVVLASSSALAQDDDFFGEFNGASDAPAENSSGDDFFGELDTASQQEDSAANATISTAEKYFMRGEFQKAVRLLSPFIGQKYDRANYMLCVIQEFGGDGFGQNNEEALKLLVEGIEGPLTIMHFFNSFVKKDHKDYEACNQTVSSMLPHLETANDPLLKFEVGIYLLDTLGQTNKGLSYLRAAEEEGYWLASLLMGSIYEHGLIGQPDSKKALEHSLRAANKGIVPAARGAGVLYKVAPEGVTQDLRLAKKYLLVAANHNDTTAIFHLGDLYNLEGNVLEAMRWFEKNVSTNEDPDSASQLGIILLNLNDDSRIKTDNVRAYQLFQFALSRNDKDAFALFGMGCSYVAGEAVAADLDVARQYFNSAIQNGRGTVAGDIAQNFLNALNEHQNSQKQNQNSGCFITTAVCENFGKPDDCFELTTFRNFRDRWLTAQPDGKSLIAEYYAVAPRIVANINRAANPAKIYETIREKYLEPCLNFIMCGDNLACKKLYVEMVTELNKIYS